MNLEGLELILVILIRFDVRIFKTLFNTPGASFKVNCNDVLLFTSQNVLLYAI